MYSIFSAVIWSKFEGGGEFWTFYQKFSFFFLKNYKIFRLIQKIGAVIMWSIV
jgi:hypothetical protein